LGREVECSTVALLAKLKEKILRDVKGFVLHKLTGTLVEPENCVAKAGFHLAFLRPVLVHDKSVPVFSLAVDVMGFREVAFLKSE
jgi:hypothetical protein